MERQLDAYCAHLRNERQVSSHTLEAYRRDLNKVLAYCEKQHVSSWKALDIQALRSLIARGCAEIVVLSLGAEGALYAYGERLERLRSPQVPVVSAVGAGDSMLGAIVQALADGRSVDAAVRQGIAAGAATVMRTGTELCHREDVQRLLEALERA